ncbi:MAG: hypothetical protein PSN37_05865 [Alphaproteobacteria bacterium]|nr:hypothetical protein [Alphaproteobacteria bacterium]
MNSFLKQISAAGLSNRIFTKYQLEDILSGSDTRRYGLVNRALKDGTLLRLKRGLYLLNPATTNNHIHPFVIAQALLPGSYISFETALSFHGWIPEAVFETESVTPCRKSLKYNHDQLGHFIFYPLALQDYQLLTNVARVTFNQRTALVASPLRALLDMVAHRKEHWSGLIWIEQGLRIDETHLTGLRRKDFVTLSGVYKHMVARDFLAQLEMAVFNRKSMPKPRKKYHAGEHT